MLSTAVTAQTPEVNDIQSNQQKRAEEQERQIQRQIPQTTDIKLDPGNRNRVYDLPEHEQNCFNISTVRLVGDNAGKFQFALDHTLAVTQLKRTLPNGRCLGAESIKSIIALTQNSIIERGYATTRISVESQDLKSGTLVLTVTPGRVGKIKSESGSKRKVLRSNAFTALPFYDGNILNLRDLEQGLETIDRPSKVEANIKITPGDNPNESDLIIVTEQSRLPISGSITLDDSGFRSTGRIQVTTTVAVDNPLSLNDILILSYGRDLFDHQSLPENVKSPFGTTKRHGGSDNWNATYLVPFGKWQLSVSANSYYYRQLIPGANETFIYRGRTSSENITLTRMLYRDRKRKVTGYIRGWTRSSNNFIDDIEIEVQRRKTAGYEIGSSYRQNIGSKILSLGFGFRKGTGANGALRAPEELFGEGTSRMSIYTAEANFYIPLKFKKIQYALNTDFRGQLNGTPLVSIDRFSIGDRNTVRGFEGESRLLGDRGFALRNEIAVNAGRARQVYFGLDGGYVAGQSAKFLVGKTLIGGAVGVRGQMKLFKNFGYDVFVGTPFYKPEGFRNSRFPYGFRISYSF